MYPRSGYFLVSNDLNHFFTGGAVSTYIAIKNIVYDENGIQVGQCYLGGDSEISAGSGGH